MALLYNEDSYSSGKVITILGKGTLTLPRENLLFVTLKLNWGALTPLPDPLLSRGKSYIIYINV